MYYVYMVPWMRSKKVYFQEAKPIKINIATIFTINQNPFFSVCKQNFFDPVVHWTVYYSSDKTRTSI